MDVCFGHGGDEVATITEMERRLIDTLEPITREIVLSVVADAETITMGTIYRMGLAGPLSCRRTVSDQTGLWVQGRELVGNVWIIVDAARVVTYCDGVERPSCHQAGRAVDPLLRYRQTGNAIWDNARATEEAHQVYLLLVEEFKARGMRWGPDIGLAWDRHHFERR